MDNVAPPIYAMFTSGGNFIAFCQSDESSVSFYKPSDIDAPQFTENTDSFNESRPRYQERGQLDGFDETVNAAWHILGGQLQSIDRRKVEKSKMTPGAYWPRIWRGRYDEENPFATYNPVHARAVYRTKFVQSIVATLSLFSYLVEIFRHVEPASENLNVFGHKIRELLILVCTEIESSWRAVLEANSTTEKTSYRTDDYFAVKEPLRLDQWRVALKDYPNLGEFSPFSEWDKQRPTKSLSWYNSYNAAKHDRESNFSRANLGDLLSAMAALHIIQAAQWGPELFDMFHGNTFSPFSVTGWPEFSASEVYIPKFDSEDELTPSRYFESAR